MISVKLVPPVEKSIGVHLLVYDTKIEMLAGLAEWDEPNANELTEAMCLGLGGADICAAIFLHRDNAGLDIVAHECWHAALRWLDAIGERVVPTSYEGELIPQDSAEELGAYYCGHLTALVMAELEGA